MFNQQQLNSLKKKKIIIVGRGSTARFVEKFNKSYFIIGFNVENIFSRKVDFFFNYKKHKGSLINKNNIKVGNINFYLYNLLKKIDISLDNKKKVYLFGFDFKKFSQDDDIYKKKLKIPLIQQIIDVNSQSIAFKIIKNQFKNLNICLCGFTIDSDASPITLKNYNISNNNNLKIVAELTTNHHGDTSRLEKLIKGSLDSGVNYVKLQMRNVETFYSKKDLEKKYITPISKTFYEYRKKLELNPEQIDMIKYYKKKYSLEIIFSALDYQSYKKLKNNGFNFFKIPSTISKHKKFIDFISNEKLNKIIVSTGMTNQQYVNYIIKKFNKFQKLYLLHCVSAYPTSFFNMNLNIIDKYTKLSKKYKNIIPGYSSHDLGKIGSMLAVSKGAKMVEKHVKIGISDWMHFDDTAIDVNNELPEFVEDLNKVYVSLGSNKKKIYPTEHHKYDFKSK
mgnify:CR=1 FL=1|tara:strand:+ start:1139 stop:2485 length:1347 start_codon:yes stop_codon:yes gene_type:complete